MREPSAMNVTAAILDITGIFPRLHIEHMTSIPGNPQVRGIIERLNGVMPDRLAKRFLTYNGIGADPNAVRIRGQQMLSLSNALRDGRELTAQNKKTLKILPTWRQLIDAVQEEIDDYNNHHGHSELPKVNGKWMSPAAYRQWVLEQEGDDIEYMTDGELREMFMPEVKRVAQRGWIALENNQYFSKELINVDRQEVRVAFDIHDPTKSLFAKWMAPMFVPPSGMVTPHRQCRWPESRKPWKSARSVKLNWQRPKFRMRKTSCVPRWSIKPTLISANSFRWSQNRIA
ncbi:Mu transposase C-terminal domain-containing protein [Serratia symbiotica]|uniref:Mu transposase C-terminal domain-containing protein n=1 Tax=Serratia symbiotica TaxID=138074 RepID=UPI0011F3D0A6|nr:Mu transposase C-terminal domain-containing protein [Serratia symbiotica]